MIRIIKPGLAFLALLLAVLLLAGCGSTAEPTAELPSVQDLFQEGNDLAQDGDFEGAIAKYQAVLELDSENVSAMSNLGVAYYSTGLLDEAVAQYQKAIELSPDDADIHSNLAAAYVQLGQFDVALEQYQKAVELQPNLAQAYYGLGVVHAQLGQIDEAIVAFEAFQEHDDGQDEMATGQAQQFLEQLRGQ